MVNVENIDAPAPTKPSRHYQRELKTLVEKDKSHPGILDIELILATENPVVNLSLDEFITVLRMAIQSHDFGTGSANTKTVIEMRWGLDSLMGKPMTPRFFEPFDWEASLNLLGPFVAFIYQRMHAEIRMLDPVPLPEM